MRTGSTTIAAWTVSSNDTKYLMIVCSASALISRAGL